MYNEIKPAKESQSIIDTFWTFSNGENAIAFNVLPDNCTDIIFDVSENSAFIVGTMSKARQQSLNGHSNLIGVRIKAENFSKITHVPLTEIRDAKVKINEILPVENNVSEQLNNYTSTADRLLFIQRLISQIEEKELGKKDILVPSVAKVIRISKGNVSINTLAASHFVSLRQLERLFKTNTGLTLKEFSSITRFNYAKKMVNHFHEKSLSEIAYDTGFFDHAHMTKAFKRISGENPMYYR